MDIEITGDRDTVVVRPKGFIDEYTAPSLRRALDKAADSYPLTVVIDFGEVDFMDSTGIGTILARYKVMRDRNIELYVKNVNRQVDKLFRLTGIYSILNVVR